MVALAAQLRYNQGTNNNKVSARASNTPETMSQERIISVATSDSTPFTPDFKRCSWCNQTKPITEFHHDSSSPTGYKPACKVCAKNRRENPIAPETLPAGFKRCSCCNQVLPTSEFYPQKDKKTGLRSQCKKCTNANEAERQRNLSPEQKEHKRQRAKKYTRLYRRTPQQMAYYKLYQQRPERKAKQKQHQQSTKRLIQQQEYKRSPRGRMFARNGTLRHRTRKLALPVNWTSQHWEACLNAFEHRCAYCGKPQGLFDYSKLTADHFIPLNDQEHCPGTIPTNMVPACKSCNSSKRDTDPHKWLVERFGKQQARQIETRIKAYFDLLDNK